MDDRRSAPEKPVVLKTAIQARMYGWMACSLVCLGLLFTRHVFHCKPNWVSFLSWTCCIVAVSWSAGLMAEIRAGGRLSESISPFKRLFALWLALFPIALFVQQYFKYRAYSSEIWDLGIISHAFSATLRGHFFENIFAGSDVPMSAFSQHTEPVFIALYPLFALFPHPLTLVAAQSIAMSCAVYFFYRLARDILKNDFSAIFSAFCFSVYPAFYYCGILDIHGDVFALPFIILMMRTTIAKKRLPPILFLIIALSCKEYVALTGFVWGAYCFFALKNKPTGIAFCVTSGAWLAGSLIIQSMLRPADVPSLFSVYYISKFGGGAPGSTQWISGILHKTFQAENAHHLFFLFIPTLFYCLRYPWIFLFLSLPLLKDAPAGISIESHRLAPVLPLIWYSVVRVLSRSSVRSPNRVSAVIALLVAGILSSALFSEAFWSQRFMRNWQSRYHHSQRAISLDEIVASVPAEAPASASAALYPHLINRRYLYLFPVLGRSAPARYAAIEKDRLSATERRATDSLMTRGEWTITKENDYGLLLKRR
jgi:uncharacterized membrane protein